MDKVLAEDIKSVCQDENIEFDKFKNSSIMVTGATGLVGSQIVKTLAVANKIRNLNIKIIAVVRSVEKAQKIFGELLNQDNIEVCVWDIINPAWYESKIDYVVHCASVTTSKTMIEKPVDTIQTAIYGTDHVLKLAVKNYVKGFVYLSSMEMYGLPDTKLSSVCEKDLGYIDILKVRSNYPESKRMCESLCVAYQSQYELPVKIARLAQTFGAGVDFESENRVFAQFAKSAMFHKNIVLHTTGKSEGNYCYTSDAVRAILMLLTKGENGEAYNIVNEDTHTTIRDMAYLVVNEVAGNQINVDFDIPAENVYGYAAETKMKLSSEKMRKLGWEPQVGLKEAYQRLIQSFEYQLGITNDKEITG